MSLYIRKCTYYLTLLQYYKLYIAILKPFHIQSIVNKLFEENVFSWGYGNLKYMQKKLLCGGRNEYFS